MTDQMITKIEQKMPEHPDNCQMKQLHAVPAACVQENNACSLTQIKREVI